jgi:hypothetical protein
MEKEFVPYEQALALKELGFDEPCIAFYNGKFLDYKIQGGDICSPYLSTENKGECPNAPLYQQVFRWFREKYDMASFIQRFEGDVFDYEINSYIFEEETDFGDGYFDTYEEAELECLKKLIEIVKENKL